MIKIIRMDYSKRKDEVVVYMWLNIESNKKIVQKIVCISTDEAMKMIDYRNKYELKDQSYYIIPRKIYNFENEICRFLKDTFNANLLEKETYKQFCNERLKIYQKIYYNEDRICGQFYQNYFPEKVCVGYKNFYQLLENNTELINANLNPRFVKKGGKFVGCYTDEYDRRRPLTSPIYYESQYNKIEQLAVALDLALENKLDKYQYE